MLSGSVQWTGRPSSTHLTLSPVQKTGLLPAPLCPQMEESQLHFTFQTPTPQKPMGRVWAQAPDIQVEESLSGVQAENLPRGLPGTPGSLTSGVSDSCSSCGAADGCSGLSPTARLPGRESACPSCPAARVTLTGTSYLLSLGQPCATSWVLTWTRQDSRCVDMGTQVHFSPTE